MKSVYRVAFSYHANLFKGQLGCLLSFMKQMKRNNKFAPRTLFLCTYLYGQVLSVRKFVTQENILLVSIFLKQIYFCNSALM